MPKPQSYIAHKPARPAIAKDEPPMPGPRHKTKHARLDVELHAIIKRLAADRIQNFGDLHNEIVRRGLIAMKLLPSKTSGSKGEAI